MEYYIASLKHTNKGLEHITFWGLDHCGYTPVIGDYIGKYGDVDSAALNDGLSHIAVPVDVVNGLISPEPYYLPTSRFYDQLGPVVDNTRANWNRLIAASLQTGRVHKPKPDPFRGKRRAIYTA